MPSKNPLLTGEIILDVNGLGIKMSDGTQVVNPDGSIAGGVPPTDIALAEGSLLVGQNTGKAGAASFKASGKVAVGDGTTLTSKTPAVAFTGASDTTSSVSGGTPAGTVAAPAFTGSASVLNLASPVFSGTGQSSAGQVITTTDTQTMSVNQCAGMWFVSATHGPYLIASNTAVSGASAVLTIIGTAPTTDVGNYKIVANIPVGTNSAPAFSGSALAGHTHTVTPTGTNAVSFS